VILLDTTPLVALCDPRDTLNRSALRDLPKLARQRFFVCAPVLTEACFHLAHPVQRERLRRVLASFSIASAAVDDEVRLWLDVFDWLEKYREHDPDWADGTLAVLSGRERRFRVWTYDREFVTTWRRPDGSRIPLATRI